MHEVDFDADFPDIYMIVESIRKQIESSDYLEGFTLTHAILGKFSCQTLTKILPLLSIEYGKKCKLNFTIFPN